MSALRRDAGEGEVLKDENSGGRRNSEEGLEGLLRRARGVLNESSIE